MDEKGTFDRQSFAPSAKRLITEQEAAEYLGCSIDTIRRMRYSGILPYIPGGRTGHRKYYDIQDLDFWIERSKVREPQ
jgi:excisionase family DNA binding protein